MTLYYIKIFAITLVVLTCIIATYTDIKYQIIPNKLTFTVGIIGFALGVYYYLMLGAGGLTFYFLSILLVYILSYILWRIGLWAGGDVKLFTTLSTLLVADYMDILPTFNVAGVIFPVYFDYISPIFELIFNSILSVLPLILLIISYEILKNKTYLMKDLTKNICLIDVVISLNTLMIFTILVDILDVSIIIEFIILVIISYLNNRISKKYKTVTIAITVITLVIMVIRNMTMIYLLESISISIIYLIRAIIKSGIISEALKNNVKIDDLTESMVLAYNLCYDGGKYYFDKRKLKEKLTSKKEDEIIISTRAAGLSSDEIKLIRKFYCEGLLPDNQILIKKTLSFGPFVLAGLLVTLTIGDVYLLILQIWRLLL